MSFRLANVAGRAALVLGDRSVDIESTTDGRLGSEAGQLLSAPSDLSELHRSLTPAVPSSALDETILGPPIPNPAQVFGVGLNYANHASEGGMDAPDLPLIFTKFRSSIAAPNAEIQLRSDYCDYEGELVVVIGPGGRDISAEHGWDHVAGLCVGQDVSDRAVQMAATPPQFSLGKSFDTFGPIGPVVVSPDELDDPSALHITTRINGELRQDGTTADLIFDIPTLVSYLSHVATLSAGDLIFTGTPGGVGVAQGLFLGDGDVITTTIDGIGTITNRCRRLPDHPYAATIPAGWRPAWKASTTDD
ncbi:MAG: fumarylacetoacetate hydrolase family protein [Ilumatobacter sp.]|nr:fumarylacetoacetate hydrolase family protein [bacterium]MCP4833473.1 fumarylacetoacetate hydrolase family protein [Phycisphaera sp.]MDG1266946.1 fumarylacetoacetate hydrolase family protein [Ilumatobacter sp.]MDG2039545.1 fumarylacetoacetate hydrolase family protein [Ilumatobacter sp.]